MDTITFDNMSAEPQSDSDQSFEEGVDQVPEIPKDKLENPESHIADADDETSPTDESRAARKETKEVKDPEGGEPAQPVISINGKEYNLKDVIEDPEAIAQLSQEIKDSELRRSDYSRKTSELARTREEFESERQKHFDEINSYMSEMDTLFMETPRLFLLKTLGTDKQGQQMPPEQAEKAIQTWIKKLSGELKMGQEYNPSQLKKQYELEARLRKMEQSEKEKRTELEKRDYETGVQKLQDHLTKKAEPQFSSESPVNALLEKLPWMKSALMDIALQKFNKEMNEQFVKGDPSWDDYKFIDNFNFKQTWSEIEKQLEEVYDEGREKYINRKKEASRKKSTSSPRGLPPEKVDKSITFADLF